MPRIIEQKPTVTVKSKCPTCGKLDSFEISRSGMRKVRKLSQSFEQALPELPKERIRQLRDHLCPSCQKIQDAKTPVSTGT